MANIRTAMNRGAFDFLTKPIDFPDLEATIAKTIRHVEDLRDARRRQAEAERAYASLSRYFSPNLVQRLAGDNDAIDLAGQRREIASLFTDIAGFTALVEMLEPSVLGPLLNEYLTGMTDIVFSHDGTVAKIVGDASMCCLARLASRPIIARVPSPARWISMNMPCHSSKAVEKRESRSASLELAFMPGQRSWGISAVDDFSTTRPMAIQ